MGIQEAVFFENGLMEFVGSQLWNAFTLYKWSLIADKWR